MKIIGNKFTKVVSIELYLPGYSDRKEIFPLGESHYIRTVAERLVAAADWLDSQAETIKEF